MTRRRGRYGNVKKPVFDGIRFDSHREMQRYCDLKLLQIAGEISELKVHPRYPLFAGERKILLKSKRYPNGRQLTYVADFSYIEHCGDATEFAVLGATVTQRPVIEDVKMQSGHSQPEYKIKRALMDCMGIPITEY